MREGERGEARTPPLAPASRQPRIRGLRKGSVGSRWGGGERCAHARRVENATGRCEHEGDGPIPLNSTCLVRTIDAPHTPTQSCRHRYGVPETADARTQGDSQGTTCIGRTLTSVRPIIKVAMQAPLRGPRNCRCLPPPSSIGPQAIHRLAARQGPCAQMTRSDAHVPARPHSLAIEDERVGVGPFG